MFFVTWYRSLVNLMSVDGWAATSVVAVFVGLMLLLAYLFGQNLILRKCGFFGVIVSFFVLLASFVFAYQQKQQFLNRSGAVVVAPSINVKQTPSDSGNDVFVVHEGTKVDITDKSMKGWVAVRVADGREGWVRTSKIEEI